MNQLTLSRNLLLTFATGFLSVCIVYPSQVAGQTGTPIQGRVILKSGGTLVGKISEGKDPNNKRSYVTVFKQDGSIIKLDQARLVRKVELVNPKTFEYQQLAANASTVEDHRTLLNWCLNQPGKRRHFKSQIESHAHHILALQPDDEQARKVLGFSREDEAWVQKDQFFGEHGYVRQGTSWTPIRAVQIQAQQQEVKEKVAQRKESLRKWLRAARRGETSSDDLLKMLTEFCDQFALESVEAAAKRDKNSETRALMVEGISGIASNSAMRKLVGFAMDDPDKFVRERALTLLGQDHYDADAASRAFGEFFSSKQNAVIQRAAYAIGELGGTSMVGELIDVLITTHTEKNPTALEPGRLNPTFRSDGTSGLNTGGGPQTITRTRRNDQVLNALKILTQQDFEFDVEQWQEWNIEANTHHNISVRAD